MSKDREFDQYMNHLDSEDHRILNKYMDNLNLEDNDELDEYLAHIEEQQNAYVQGIEGVEQPIYTQDMNGINPQDIQTGMDSYIQLEPEIENFQDYTTTRMEPVNPENMNYGEVSQESLNEGMVAAPLQESLLNEDSEPYVDTIRYKNDERVKADEVKNNKVNESGSVERNFEVDRRGEYSDDLFYIDNVPKRRKAPVIAAVLLILLVLGGGCYAAYYFTDGFKDFAFLKKESETEEDTEIATSTEATTEEATTEEPSKPYATVDYVLHKPHATDSTIVYNSNPYSLRYPQEEWPITRDDNGDQREATQDDLYPVIDLEAVEGSLNSTNPDPSNPGETQQMTSRYMVLVDLSDDSIVAKRDSDIVVNPASMTKILTVLTAADMIEDLDDTYEVPMEAIDYSMVNGCSAVGFLAGEKITVRDMIYGTIVCSGADAAVTLADYCCGSQDAFVEKMNEKVEELGISDTAHFTNVVGVYDENLHCTMEDMAVIISTAMQNEFLKDVLSTRIYQTTPDPTILPEDVRKELGIEVNEETKASEQDDSNARDDSVDNQNVEGADGQNDDSEVTSQNDAASTEQNEGTDESEDQPDEADNAEQAADAQTESADGSSEESTTEEIDPGVLLVATEGIQISNWFMRRIEDKDTGGEVLGAKTGFVNASGFCCASYYKSNSGKEYVCVTGDTYSSWRCIYDHVGIYRSLAK